MSNRRERFVRRIAKSVAKQAVVVSGGSGSIGITDVTGLSAALTAKADASHGHLAGDITDLDDVLNEYVTETELTTALSTLTIEARTDDPASPATGRIWLRTDL